MERCSRTHPIGAATATSISGFSRFRTAPRQADAPRRRRRRAVVLGRRKPDRVSVEPAGRRHLRHPDARRRRAAARGAGASRRAFRPTDAGSPGSRNQAAAESTSLQPPAARHARSRRASIGRRHPSGRPTAGICCSGGSATATPTRKNNVDWYVAAIPGGSPVRDRRARVAAARRVSGVPGAAVSRCVGRRGESHPVSWQRRRLLEHVAGGHRPGAWRSAGRPSGDVRHDRRSGRLGDLRRTDGVHQPHDGGGHLEPADRRRIAASRRAR